MSPWFVIVLILAYFGILIGVSLFTRKEETNKTFFTGNRDSKWYIIAFGMIGTSISGITFISVPGAVGTGKFGYMQVVLGYLLGYMIVAYVLLPLYYRMNLTSIYQYLEQRFGQVTYKTGAIFFLISRLIGSGLRLGVVAIVLHQLVFMPLNIPFWVSVCTSVGLIYLYTFQSGVKTVIWTDTVQTVGLLAGLIITIVIIMQRMQWGVGETFSQIADSNYSQWFFWDWKSSGYFWKTFLGGAAITVSMTGLDQDMMQKNLACRNIEDAQKNMRWFSLTLVVVNLLFLGMGVLLYLYAESTGLIQWETISGKMQLMFKNQAGGWDTIRTDALFPRLANEHLGKAAAITFILGVIAAAYSSADSAMTALTSSFCIDILGFEKRNLSDKEMRNTRYKVHIMFALLVIAVIMYFYWLNDQSLIDKVLGVAGYTYGPLLGLYAFGILTKYQVRDKWVPLICIIAPVVSYFLQSGFPTAGGPWFLTGSYKFGIEILIVNGLLTFVGLWLIKTKEQKNNP